MTHTEPRGQELVRRYKKNYGILPGTNITEEMILTHWALERQLTSELMQSTPDNRAATFERCYSRLYSELDWLNRSVGEADVAAPSRRFGKWVEEIGSPPKSVYEIGSGKGELIAYLADLGFHCKASEITSERGGKLVKDPHATLSWGASDGVHLDRFESPDTYDVVVSDQVIEHLHPADVEIHLKSVHKILAVGGRYIFCTPHLYTGPHDVSRVFKVNQPRGMHLKEYTYQYLVEATKKAGFRSVYYAFLPGRLRRSLEHLNGLALVPAFRVLHLRQILVVERMLSTMPTHRIRRLCSKALRRAYLFPDGVCLVAKK
jgi:SAM-dependent methyltransferase